MGIYFWLRVGVMVVALGAIIAIINSFGQDGKAPKFLEKVFGPSASQAAKVNLCPTRVVGIEGPNWSIYQQNLKWYRKFSDREAEELDAVATEKWFGEYCSIEALPESEEAKPEPYWTIKYVSGAPVAIGQTPSRQYAMNGMYFRSRELDIAGALLLSLPAKTIPGQREVSEPSAEANP